jgi:hypothetical protein
VQRGNCEVYLKLNTQTRLNISLFQMSILLILQITSCVGEFLGPASEGLSEASTSTVLMMNTTREVKKQVKNLTHPKASSETGVPSISSVPLVPATLRDDPFFGKLYLINTQLAQFVNYSGQYKDRWTGAVSQVSGKCLRVVVQIEAVAKSTEKELLPQIVQFEEDKGSLGEIAWKLRNCAWFRIKTKSAEVDPKSNSLPCIIRGFDRTGKCIFYKEWEYFPEGLHPKEPAKPTPVESASKPEARIVVPKMINPP